MKKLVVLLMILCLGCMFVACGGNADVEENNTSQEEEMQQEEQAEYDQFLLSALRSWVNTTQPGTAGTSLKAVAATKDMLLWAEGNALDEMMIVNTVTYFLAQGENALEAQEAFGEIANVIAALEAGTAEDLLADAGFGAEDFTFNDEILAPIKVILQTVAQFNVPTEEA